MTVGEIIGVLKLKDEMTGPLQNAINGMKGATAAATQATGATGMLGGSLKSVFTGMASFTGGMILFNTIGNVLQGAKSAVIDMNAELETTTLQFETLTGSADKAKEIVADLFEFAKKTPFETGEIIRAARFLQTFGGTALNTKENLTMIGDAAAATKAPFEHLSMWVGRMYSAIQAGRPFGEAAMRLQELAVLTPSARNQLEALSKQGKKGEEVWKVFTDELGRFNGAMLKQATTWSGLTSTFKDNIQMTTAQIMKPFFEMSKKVLMSFNSMFELDAVEQGIKGLASFVQSAFSTAERWFAPLVQGAKNIWAALAQVFSGGEGSNALAALGQWVSEAVRSVTKASEWIRDRMIEAAAAIIEFKERFAAGTSAIKGLVQPIIDAFKPIVEKLRSVFVNDTGRLLSEWKAAFVEAFGSIGQVISRIISVFKPVFDRLYAMIVSDTAATLDNWVATFKTAINAVSSVIKAAGAIFDWIVPKIAQLAEVILVDQWQGFILFWRTLGSAVNVAIQYLEPVVKMLWNLLRPIMDKAWSVFINVFNVLVGAFRMAYNGIEILLQGLLWMNREFGLASKIATALEVALWPVTTVLNVLLSALDVVVTGVRMFIDWYIRLQEYILRGNSNLKLVGDLVTLLGAGLKWLGSQVIAGLTMYWRNLTEPLRLAWQWFSKLWTSTSEGIGFLTQMWEALKTMYPPLDAVVSGVKALWEWLTKLAGGAIKKALDGIASIVGTLGEKWSKFKTDVASAADEVRKKAIPAMDDATAKANASGQALQDAFAFRGRTFTVPDVKAPSPNDLAPIIGVTDKLQVSLTNAGLASNALNAEMSGLAKDLAKPNAALAQTADATGKAGEKIAELRKSLTGLDVIETVNEILTAVKSLSSGMETSFGALRQGSVGVSTDLSGLYKLSADGLKKVQEEALKALTVIKGMGDSAPPSIKKAEKAIRELYQATVILTGDPGLQHWVENFKKSGQEIRAIQDDVFRGPNKNVEWVANFIVGLRSVRDVLKLTAEDQKELSKKIVAAMEDMRRKGEQIPDLWVELAGLLALNETNAIRLNATFEQMTVPPVLIAGIPLLTGLSNAFVEVETKASKFNEQFQTLVTNLGMGQFNLGFKLEAKTGQQIENDAKVTGNRFMDMFGETLAGLGGVILSAFTGGGDALKSASASLASGLGSTLATNIQDAKNTGPVTDALASLLPAAMSSLSGYAGKDMATGLASTFTSSMGPAILASKTFTKTIETINGPVKQLTTSGKLLGGAFAGVGAAFEGFSIGAQTGSKALGALGGAASGAMKGFAMGGPLGAAIGGLAGLVGGLFGASGAAKKARTAFIESAGGMAKVKEMAEYAGYSLDKLLNTKSKKTVEKEIKNLEAALKAAQERVQKLMTDLDKVMNEGGIITSELWSRIANDAGKDEVKDAFVEIFKASADQAASGFNKIAKNILLMAKLPTSEIQTLVKELNDAMQQGRTANVAPEFLTTMEASLERVGVLAQASFGALLTAGKSIPEALAAIAPGLDEISALLQATGLHASDTLNQLLGWQGVVAANQPVFEMLQGLDEMITGLSNAGLLTQETFSALGTTMADAFEALKVNGVSASDALRMMQPQLQKLWEAQQAWGFEIDSTTQAMIDQATEQGIVGEKMKSVNDKILDVLVAIGEALGAKIPAGLKAMGVAAEEAAAQTARAFGSIKSPQLDGTLTWNGEETESLGRKATDALGRIAAPMLNGTVTWNGGTADDVVTTVSKTFSTIAAPMLNGTVTWDGKSVDRVVEDADVAFQTISPPVLDAVITWNGGNVEELTTRANAALESINRPMIDGRLTWNGEAIDDTIHYAASAMESIRPPVIDATLWWNGDTIDEAVQYTTDTLNTISPPVLDATILWNGEQVEETAEYASATFDAITAPVLDATMLWNGTPVDETVGIVHQALGRIAAPLLDGTLTWNGAAIDDTVSQVTSAFKGIRAPVLKGQLTWDIEGLPEFTAPEVTGSFAMGTKGLRDFGAGSLAMLHGREAVLPEDEYKALLLGKTVQPMNQPVDMSGLADLSDEIAAMRRETAASNATLPSMLARAVRDALLTVAR